MSEPANRPLLEVQDMKMFFPVYGGVFQTQVATVKAIDGISFTIDIGETLGLVGESGCGKSTTGKCIINLHPPTSGKVLFHSQAQQPPSVVDLAQLDNAGMRPYRSEIQMIFQDPYASLNPRMTVREIVQEPIQIHKPTLSRKEVDDRIAELLKKVGLSEEQAFRYPHEFSGGQRQRIGIARSLATNPRLIIADEPVSALDVSIQAQVLNLMKDLQKEFQLTYLFISHNLAVVEHVSDRIAVMYLGNIVEIGKTEEIFSLPSHPYTRALMSAIPSPDPREKGKKRMILQGDVPTPLNKPSGCGFRTRCPIARETCARGIPASQTLSVTHQVACPYFKEMKRSI